MLHIFFMDKGSFERLETRSSCVRNLMEDIQMKYGLPTWKQILLVSGGYLMDPESPLSSYTAGDSLSNPIYLFNQDCSRETYRIQPKEIVISSDEMQIKIQNLIEKRPGQHALVERARFMDEFRQYTHDLYTSLDCIVQEQQFMVQGWFVALANADEESRLFRDYVNRANYLISYIKNQEDLWKYCNEKLCEIRNLLERIPILPTLLVNHSNNNSLDEEIENSSLNVSLYQWIVSRCGTTTRPLYTSPSTADISGLSPSSFHTSILSHSPLFHLDSSSSPSQLSTAIGGFKVSGLPTSRNWLDESLRLCTDLQVIKVQRLVDCCNKLLKLGTNVADNPRLDCEPLNERLQGLTPLLKQMEKYLVRINAIYDELHRTKQQWDGGNGQSLNDICANHVELLREVNTINHNMTTLVVRCNQSKRELAELMYKNQNWMSRYQQDVNRMYTRIRRLDAQCKILDRFSVVVKQMESAPRLYAQCLREIVRRRELLKGFKKWAKQSLHVNTDVECEQRLNLATELKKHFLQSIFAQMTLMDMSPYEMQNLLYLDRRLPQVTREDLKHLANVVPELKVDLLLKERTDEQQQNDNLAALAEVSCQTSFALRTESLPISIPYSRGGGGIGIGDDYLQQQEVSHSPAPIPRPRSSTQNSSHNRPQPAWNPCLWEEERTSGSMLFDSESACHLGESPCLISPPNNETQSPPDYLPNVGLIDSFHTTHEQFSPRSSNPKHGIAMSRDHNNDDDDDSMMNSQDLQERQIFELCSPGFVHSNISVASFASAAVQTDAHDSTCSQYKKLHSHFLQVLSDIHHIQHEHCSIKQIISQRFKDFWTDQSQLSQSLLQSINSVSIINNVDAHIQTELDLNQLTVAHNQQIQEKDEKMLQMQMDHQLLKDELTNTIGKLESETLLMKTERSKEIDNLRQQHANILSQLKESYEQNRQMALNEIRHTLTEKWEQEKREIHQRYELMFNEKALELQGSIDSLSESNAELNRKLHDLRSQQMKDRELIRRLKSEGVTLSSSPSSRGDIDHDDKSSSLAIMHQSSSMSTFDMPGSVYGTVLSSSVMDASMSSNCLDRLTLHGRVLKFVHHNFKSGDVVAFVPVRCSSGDQWRMISTDGELYFLHESGYSIIASTTFVYESTTTTTTTAATAAASSSTTPTNDDISQTPLSQRRDLLKMGVFLNKEKCQSRKIENRFDLPLDCIFYRVKIRPRLYTDTARS